MTFTDHILASMLPQLRRLSGDERHTALGRARATPFDVAELVGIALAVAAATAITRHALPAAPYGSGLLALAANFVLAVPLIAICIAPLHLRRLRRGLRRHADQQTA